ncbi:adenylate/guanylate cyclase domain-containing protein [Candidatus Woesearchaeota archaeon]|nr:adenylate/guanylate cyclase domain-containing protein [Candidatus Woesearchaeota archaeon]
MKARHSLVTGLIVAILISLAYSSIAFSPTQARLQDTLYGGKNPLNNIIILAIDDKSIQEIGRWPWDRDVYAKMLPILNGSKAIAIDVIFSEPQAEKDEQFARALTDAGNVILSVEYTGFEKTQQGMIGQAPLLPVPELKKAARSLGAINLITDPDGVVRAANTNLQESHPLLAETVALHLGVKTQKQDRRHINYIGPAQSYTTIPFSDVLNGRTKVDFTNKIVFIGATAPNLHDDHITPTGRIPGVEVQANLFQTILTRTSLNPMQGWIVVLLIFIEALLVSVLLVKLNTWAAGGITFITILAYLIVAVNLFNRGILPDLLFIPITGVTSYVANLVHLYLRERKERKYIHDAFSRYVAPEVVKELMKNPDKLKLGGERRQITIFFSDIRGFTTFSEALTPEKLVQLLNEYLTAMTNIIMDHGGVVDKYIGDAIMAFWGAPLDQPDHAERAANATIAMNKKLAEMQHKWEKEGYPKVEIGSGINTGPAVVGNMGSHQRFNYTVMGDTINLGSRLEGITKEYGVKTIVSETTRKELPKEFITRELDLVRVKGKKEPIRIYELFGKELTDKQKHIIKHWNAGLEKYRAKEFKKAIDDFAKAAHEGDKTSAIYIERCEHFMQEHPGKDWDCVWVMKTK